jgi:pantothenate kinase
MEQTYESLALRTERILQESHNHRIIIAIAGVPGSGKTTLAHKVASILNSRNGGNGIEWAKPVPMDGYHLYRKELDAMDDPALAHERRGAPFTFNAKGVIGFVQKVHETSKEKNMEMISCPSFDHAIKDPVEGGVVIYPETRVILFEGLYVLLNCEPWNKIQKYVDDKWFITVNAAVAIDRVAKRHVESGISADLESGIRRASTNDADNGKLIVKISASADVVIKSIDED